MKKDIPQGKFGWICPICGTVYSPEVKTCSQCNKQVATNTESMIPEIGINCAIEQLESSIKKIEK